MDLANRVVLLTGGRRLGAPLASALAARGADVALVYHRSRAAADETAAAVRAAGRRALVMQADLSQEAAGAAVVEQVDRAFSRLDVLLNMASLYQAVPIDQLDVAAWDRQLAVDLRGSFVCARAVVPLMRRGGGGRIINFTDWVVASGRPRYKGFVAYYVAKAGVKALTEALALELAADQILVNAVAPGPILAPPGTSEADLRAVERATPLGRWGGAGEVVKVVLALIDSDFITGETIRVDGGRHVS
jgi:NAD(P)-dependent dehydrogenase (short-subunit alcohol dehydrogenase family)